MLLLQSLSTLGIHLIASSSLIFSILSISAVSSAADSSRRIPTLDHTAFPVSLSRRESCASSSNSRCSAPAQAFCCPTSAECISINNGTSVICCPDGEDCSFIQTVDCQSTFATCGGRCCPLGYDCDSSDSNPNSIGCRLRDENKPQSYRLRDECAKLNGNEYSSDSCNALIEATKKSCLQECDQFPVKAIATGFFPGMAVGATVMLFIGLYMRRREMKALAKAGAWRTEKGVDINRGFSTGKESRSTGRNLSSYNKELDMPTIPVRSFSRRGPRTSRRATTHEMGLEHVGAYIPRRHRSATERMGHGHVQRRARSVDALSSTEIAIGYDRKQDEQFMLRSGHMEPGPPTPTFQQRTPTPLGRSATRASGTIPAGMAVLWESDLKSSSDSFRVRGAHVSTLSVNTHSSTSGSITTAVVVTAATHAANPRRVTPTRITILDSTTSSPSPPSQPSSRSALPSPSLPEMSPPIVGSTTTAARPLTHEHLLQHQQLHSGIPSPTPADTRNPQSSYRTTSMPSSPSTSLYLSDEGAGPSDRRHRRRLTPHGNLLSAFHRDRRRRKPPSDVTSCITDGEYDG